MEASGFKGSRSQEAPQYHRQSNRLTSQRQKLSPSIGSGSLRDLKYSIFFLILFVAASTCYFVVSSRATGYQRHKGLAERDINRSEEIQLLTSSSNVAVNGSDGETRIQHKQTVPSAKKNKRSKAKPQHPRRRVKSPRKTEAKSPVPSRDQPRYQDRWNYLKMKDNITMKQYIYTKNETEAIQKQRQTNMRRVCEDTFHIHATDVDSQMPLDSTFKGMLGNTYVNDDYNLTVTITRKVASSNWRRFMSHLHSISSRGFKARWRRPLGTLKQRNPNDIQHVLRHYTKVLFVRNPLVRLLSAFSDKFVKLPTSFYVNKANKIINKIRHKKPVNSAMPELTFTEFLRFIIGSKGRDGDVHWFPVFQTHAPCHVRYDFIGKLETLPQDTEYLIEKLGLKGRIEFDYPRPYTGSSNTSLLIESYAHVPPDVIEGICEIYKDDFITFDYPIPKNFSNLKEYMKAIT